MLHVFVTTGREFASSHLDLAGAVPSKVRKQSDGELKWK